MSVLAVLRRAVAFEIKHKLQPGATAVLVAYGWSQLLRAPFGVRDALLIGITASGVYQLNRISDPEDAINCREEWEASQRNKHLIIVIFICSFLFSVLLAVTGHPIGPLVEIILGCFGLGFLYSNPLRSGHYRLKKVMALKELLPAFGWSLLTVGIAGLHTTLVRSSLVVLVAASYNFCQVLIIELLWNIRDEIGDRIAGVRSISICLGAARTIYIAHGLNLVAALIVVRAYFQTDIDAIWLLAVCNSIFVAGWLVVGKARMHERWVSHAMQASQASFALSGGLVASIYYH